MPDPHESLAIFAEIAIALAGFSGIVIAFGRREIRVLSALEQRRLANLFMLSGFVLCASLFAIAMLHVEALTAATLWRLASGATFLLGSAWLLWDLRKVAQLKARHDDINLSLVAAFDTLAALALALLVYNFFALHLAWPVFIALAVITAGAFQQFILLVQMHLRVQNDTPEPERMS